MSGHRGTINVAFGELSSMLLLKNQLHQAEEEENEGLDTSRSIYINSIGSEKRILAGISNDMPKFQVKIPEKVQTSIFHDQQKDPTNPFNFLSHSSVFLLETSNL